MSEHFVANCRECGRTCVSPAVSWAKKSETAWVRCAECDAILPAMIRARNQILDD